MINKIILLLSIFLPSRLRIILLNIMGHNISKNAKLSLFSIILAGRIEIAHDAKVDSFAIIVGLKTLKMLPGSGISRFSYISGNMNFVLNKRSLIGSRCVINTSSGDVIFGEYSVLAPRSTVYTHGTFLPVTHGYSGKNKGIAVGNFTWIMQNASIGPGVTIGSNVIVLPGSTIVKDISDNCVVYDTPVERKNFPMSLFKKEFSDDELQQLIKEITRAYLIDLSKKNKKTSFEEFANYFQIKIKKQTIIIHLQNPDYNTYEKDSNDQIDCYFGFKIDSSILNITKYFVLDFFNIISSKIKPPSIFKDYAAFMFYEYGLKFIFDSKRDDDIN